MKIFTFALLVVAMAACSNHPEDVHWSYSGAGGPENWGTLDPEFELCSSGMNQSPIDLSGFVDEDLDSLGVHYLPGGTEVLNNGHAIKVNYEPGSNLQVGDQSFELKQFHFHSPSENTIEGESYPLEMHLVHADEAGNLAVLGVMFEEGEGNPVLNTIWTGIPSVEGEFGALSPGVDAENLLPEDRNYYRFNGSLTTPPCSEGVTWMVLSTIETASPSQLKVVGERMGHPNNRPLQPTNARTILE